MTTREKTKRIIVGGVAVGGGAPVSVQPMSTLFEQQLYLLCDMITLEIMDRLGWDEATVKARHANLE